MLYHLISFSNLASGIGHPVSSIQYPVSSLFYYLCNEDDFCFVNLNNCNIFR
jgi:hypothetical protein